MGEPRITLDDVRAAVEFSPELCQPLAETIMLFDDYLPAEDMMIAACELSGPFYFSENSNKIKYYYDTLTKFKESLGGTVKADELAKRFDPAIRFFKDQLDSGRSVRLNCGNEPVLETIAPTMSPLEKEGSVDIIGNYLKNKFGLNFATNIEEWFSHRIFYSDINKKSDQLVLVISEVHDLYEVGYDQVRLLKHLVDNSQDRYDVIVALEDTPHYFAYYYDEIMSGKDERLKERISTGENILAMRREYQKDDKFAEDFCNDLVKKGLPRERCDTAYRRYSMTASFFTINGISLDKYWPLEDEKLNNEMEDTFVYLKGGSCKSEEECFSLGNKASVESIKERSLAMGKKLGTLIKKSSSAKKPRMIMVRCGALHAADIIRTLPADLNISVVGLVSKSFADILKEVSQ